MPRVRVIRTGVQLPSPPLPSKEGKIDLPDEVKGWIELWLKQKGTRPAVLLALFDPLYLGTSSSIQVYLREVARRGHMEFLARSEEKPED